MDPAPHIVPTGVLNHCFDSTPNIKTLEADLAGKIVYDDRRVFKRLCTDNVDNGLVSACAGSFQRENQKDIDLLKQLVTAASRRDIEELEREEMEDKASDPNRDERSGNHGSEEETLMYDPLVRLFNFIATFDNATPAIREFRKTCDMLKPNEPHTLGFPSSSPDLTIVANRKNQSTKWRDRDAFGEVQPTNKQGPKPTISGTIPTIVTQCADYARLFMSSRPFMLFCVGILIFGTQFCVGIFDRDGITFSPIYDMFEQSEVLIRVIRSLACNLSIEKLGSDPTVHTLSDTETQRLASERSKGFSSAVVSSVGSDRRLWCTIGPPLWTSVSFLGRGTHVWLVRQYVGGTDGRLSCLQGNDMIMKTAWRSSARSPESDIYMAITEPPEGLAKFECGGDVKFAGCLIAVQNLRSDMVNNPLPGGDHPPTPVLHRLVLRTVGHPMWEYSSDLELLMGFRDALRAHENLWNQGILHRDISAGNILLAAGQNRPFRGFIADLEFASIAQANPTKPTVIVKTTVGSLNKYDDRGRLIHRTEPTVRTHIKFGMEDPVKRGAAMTGTAQFMARELLEEDPDTFVHEVRHDLESFIWVLSYCVMRSMLKRASKSPVKEVNSQSSNFRKLMSEAFGLTTKREIAKARHGRATALDFFQVKLVNNIVLEFMSYALIDLFKTLQDVVYKAGDYQTPTPITHATLLAAVNTAITTLQVA